MNLSKFFLLQLNGLFPFLFPIKHLFRNFNYFKGVIYYYKDYFTYKKMDRSLKSPFPLRLQNAYPIYYDRFEEAGEIPKHYFHQDLWAARKIFQSKVKTHHDIGSRIDSFISHCLVFCKVVMLDVRPLKASIGNLDFIQADCMNMKNVRTNSIESISSLHAVEHFGLGRYGDPIDPMGYQKAIAEIIRVTKKGGNIYFGGPIGKQRLEFNAHRVYNPKHIIDLFEKGNCELKEFSAVDDTNKFIEKTTYKKFTNANYSCGLFHFVKKSV